MPKTRPSRIAVLIMSGTAAWWSAGCKKAQMPLPAVGTAEVQAETMVLFSRADASAPPAAGLIKGDKVHLLQVPKQPGPEFVAAQLVKSGVVSPPGFARAAELGNWASDRPEEALRLLLQFARPAPDAARETVRSYWKKLEDWEQRFNAAPGIERISLELAREYLFWAEAAGAHPELKVDRPNLVNAARQALGRAAGSAAEPEARVIEAVARQVESMPLAPVKAVAGPNFDDVHALWGRGDYTTALQRVDQILAANPGNPQAANWKARLQAAIEAERALSR